MDAYEVILGVVIFLFVGMLIGAGTQLVQTKQLGQAICEEHYNADFDYFEYEGINSIKEIVCKKPPKPSEKYDGLIVKIE